MILEYGDALAELIRLAQPDVCPVLTEPEQDLILDRHQRASVWVASTEISLGLKIIPTAANRNGVHYKAVAFTTTATDQKTGATEPSWSTTRGARITDNHVIWEEDGWDWDGVLWDMAGAAEAAWLLKASKASPTSDFATDSMEIKSSQLFDHCMEMAKKFQPVYLL